MPPFIPSTLEALASVQSGVVSRTQVLASGLTDEAVHANLVARRWQRIHPGVFALFTGPLPERSRVWAALLWAGDDAALADVSALREYGFETANDSATIHVRVDHDRRVAPPQGIALRRRRRLEEFVHPVRVPRVLRLEDAALHTASDRADLAAALALLADVCSQRLTTPHRLHRTLAGLPKLPKRRAIWSVLDDIALGTHSFLEWTYLERVERRHGLPTPLRQVADASQGRRLWRDAEYAEWGVILELDGRLGHEVEADLRRDRRRDLISAGRGKLTVRNGYAEVVGEPCETAALVSCVLQARGWRGQPLACDARCDIVPRLAALRCESSGRAS